MKTKAKILHLTLKKKWFDMIASGEKTEEYREIKDYWFTRLVENRDSLIESYFDLSYKMVPDLGVEKICKDFPDQILFKKYDLIRFKNGYAKDAPVMTFEWGDISIGRGNVKWGAFMHSDVFIIKMGRRVE